VSAPQLVLRRLTFELTPTAKAGGVSRDGDDSTAGAGPAYDACRSGSGVERVVRHQCALGADPESCRRLTLDDLCRANRVSSGQ